MRGATFSALQRAENSSIRSYDCDQQDFCAFSALQRAENSSIAAERDGGAVGDTFQCSSASRKFLNGGSGGAGGVFTRTFSALQRAENSSIAVPDAARDGRGTFQCSSASRKFLNLRTRRVDPRLEVFQCSSASRKFLNLASRTLRALDYLAFSALQRAENSSMRVVTADEQTPVPLSVLFSEPKIPQF